MTDATPTRAALALKDADEISARMAAKGYRATISDVERLRNHVRALAAPSNKPAGPNFAQLARDAELIEITPRADDDLARGPMVFTADHGVSADGQGRVYRWEGLGGQLTSIGGFGNEPLTMTVDWAEGASLITKSPPCFPAQFGEGHLTTREEVISHMRRPGGPLSLAVEAEPDPFLDARVEMGRVWNLGAGGDAPEGADLLTQLRAAQASTLTEGARWRKISHAALEGAIKAVEATEDALERGLAYTDAYPLFESLGEVLALARLKWGNLDPDANTVFEKAEGVLAKAAGWGWKG